MSSVLSFAIFLVAADRAPPIVALAVTADGTHVLAGSQGAIDVFALPDLKRVQSLPTKLEHVHDLSFSPSGKLLAAAGGSPGERGAVELWEWPAAMLQATLPAGDDVAYDAAWNAEGTQLAVACGDKTVRVIDATAREGNSKATTTLRPHSAAVLAIVWLGSDEFILSASIDQTIRVLKPPRGETVRSLDNHTAAVRDLAIRPGMYPGPAVIASAGADRTVRFWQPAIGRLVRFARLPVGPNSICWSGNGAHLLAACEDGRLRAIDYESLAITELPDRLDGWAHAVAVLPGGQSALLAGERGQLRIGRLNAINP
jgi:WD40 repeat protein